MIRDAQNEAKDRDIGIRPSALFNWLTKYCVEYINEGINTINHDGRDKKLCRLHRENRILKEQREILIRQQSTSPGSPSDTLGCSSEYRRTRPFSLYSASEDTRAPTKNAPPSTTRPPRSAAKRPRARTGRLGRYARRSARRWPDP